MENNANTTNISYEEAANLLYKRAFIKVKWWMLSLMLIAMGGALTLATISDNYSQAVELVLLLVALVWFGTFWGWASVWDSRLTKRAKAEAMQYKYFAIDPPTAKDMKKA